MSPRYIQRQEGGGGHRWIRHWRGSETRSSKKNIHMLLTKWRQMDNRNQTERKSEAKWGEISVVGKNIQNIITRSTVTEVVLLSNKIYNYVTFTFAEYIIDRIEWTEKENSRRAAGGLWLFTCRCAYMCVWQVLFSLHIHVMIHPSNWLSDVILSTMLYIFL